MTHHLIPTSISDPPDTAAEPSRDRSVPIVLDIVGASSSPNASRTDPTHSSPTPRPNEGGAS